MLRRIMEIVKKKISDLKPAPYNPRIDLKKTDKATYDKLKHSIESFGLVQPIIWNKRTGYVVGGHQRLEILKDKGETEIDCIEVDLSEGDEKGLNLALNKVSGDWDTMKLNELLINLKETEYKNIDVTGFDENEINDILLQFQEPKDEIFELPKEPKYKIKQGDVFILGNHRLMCGDSTNKEDVERLMNGEKANAVLTDPPYSFGKDMINDDINETQLTELNRGFIRNIISKDNSTFICFHGTRPFPTVLEGAKDTNWKFKRMLWLSKPNDITFPWHGWILKSESILVFQKGKGSYNEIKPYVHDTYVFNHPGNYNKTIEREGIHPLVHPSIKPLPVLLDVVKRISKENELIYDAFGGSGTTLIACEQTNRICYMMEIDPYYCSVIIERWESYTNKKHKKIGERNGI